MRLVIVVGVMARLLCDYGLQFSENFVYQSETPIFPHTTGNEVFQMVPSGGLLGDAIIPDEYHFGFKLQLPANLPPSAIFLSPDTSMGPGSVGDSPWGLTYYLYAYIATSQAHFLQNSLSNPIHNGTRKSSKVFLSFTRSVISDQEALLKRRSPPSLSISKTLMPSSKQISLDAALERNFFYANDPIAVHVKVNNPKGAAIGGLRITLKQLITTRCLNEAKQITKVPLAVYEFPSVDENGRFVIHSNGLPLKEYPFLIDTVRVTLKPGNFLQQVAVESRLPRTAIRELLLAPSFEQNYDFGNSNLRYYAIEYYMNVHVIVPWGANLIAKLPFSVASRGASESIYSGDNLATLQQSAIEHNSVQANSVEDDDFEGEAFKKPTTTSTSKDDWEVTVQEFQVAIENFPKERLWREFDSSLRQLDGLHRLNAVSAGNSQFEASRRTWTRELAEAGSELKAKIDGLASLVAVCDSSFASVACGRGCAAPRPIDASIPSDLISALGKRFIPAYLKLVGCHLQAEHREAMLEALNLLLDTIELVYMKFHLSLPGSTDSKRVIEVDAEFSGDQLWALIRGRLERDFLRLMLVVPGMVEWRWFLEGLLAWAVQKGAVRMTRNVDLSDALMWAGQPAGEDTNYELATAFQGIHERLVSSFTDASIGADEIVAYGRLLAGVLMDKGEEQQGRIAKAHYAYFKVALFVYFGAYGALLVPFDEAVEPVVGLRVGDLKTLREALQTSLRQDLIQSMQS